MLLEYKILIAPTGSFAELKASREQGEYRHIYDPAIPLLDTWAALFVGWLGFFVVCFVLIGWLFKTEFFFIGTLAGLELDI